MLAVNIIHKTTIVFISQHCTRWSPSLTEWHNHHLHPNCFIVFVIDSSRSLHCRQQHEKLRAEIGSSRSQPCRWHNTPPSWCWFHLEAHRCQLLGSIWVHHDKMWFAACMTDAGYHWQQLPGCSCMLCYLISSETNRFVRPGFTWCSAHVKQHVRI